MNFEGIIRDEAKKNIPRLKKATKSHWLSERAIDIADRRRNAKTNAASKQEINKISAEFQKQSRKDKENHLNALCMEIEENNKVGKTRDLFKQIKEITGEFKPRLGD